MNDLVHTLIVDNHVLYTEPGDYHSGNGFTASKRLEQNKRIIRSSINGFTLRRDMVWFMKTLPAIAEFFGLGRTELLGWWMEDYGLPEFIESLGQEREIIEFSKVKKWVSEY